MIRAIEPPADEDKAVAVEQRHADAGAIGEIFKLHRECEWRAGNGGVGDSHSIRHLRFRRSPFLQLCFALAATAVIGTRSRPRLSAAFAHLAM